MNNCTVVIEAAASRRWHLGSLAEGEDADVGGLSCSLDEGRWTAETIAGYKERRWHDTRDGEDAATAGMSGERGSAEISTSSSSSIP
ncbi:hypothetical protein PIB30_061439 [Stylosanthes scabra]|uniref:Uncharacterized protein n=1 Tax=Stylosanthes scabra TaxID=79078 RepID=A0ABU6QKC0_9FABA|nr:hypothetical protein [Stylosanthes scabra]